MKAVVEESFVPQRARQREAARHLGHLPMKAGIEAHHLRNAWELRGQSFDCLDLNRNVQWRERNQTAQGLDERWRHAFRIEMIRTAMDYAMADRIGARQPQTFHFVEERAERVRRSRKAPFGVAERLRAAVANPKPPTIESDPFRRPLGQQFFSIEGEAIERELVRGRTAVEGKYDVRSIHRAQCLRYVPGLIRNPQYGHFQLRISGLSMPLVTA